MNFIKKYIHVSTPEVYGSTSGLIKENFNFLPSTPYAVSRAACDMHLFSFLKLIIFQLYLLEQQMFMVLVNNCIE